MADAARDLHTKSTSDSGGGVAAPVLRETPDVLLDAARRYAREGRESHVLWAEHLRAHRNGAPCESCTAEVIATAGDVEVQDEWVRKYEVILLALDLVDETLAVRLVDAVARLADEGMRDRAVYFAQRALRYREEARRVAA